MSFLTAEWRRLAFANYAIDPDILKPYIPAHTELDSFDGVYYVSLVGFVFKNVRLLGIKVPFHVNFEEVNLRFYVRYKEGVQWKRGVVFIKEIVPKAAITLVANSVYHEKYETQKMSHLWETNETGLRTRYEWRQKDIWQSFETISSKDPRNISKGSIDEFITEHYWGYSKQSHLKTTEYEVTHPRWQVYDVKEYTITMDFVANYGAPFSVLQNATPASVMLAEGSPITIESKRSL